MLIKSPTKFIKHTDGPPRIKIRPLLVNVQKVHHKVDEAFNILALYGNVVDRVVHDQQVMKYECALHLLQNDFLIASKIMLLSKIVRYVFQFTFQPKDIAANYTLILFFIIFVSENFLS